MSLRPLISRHDIRVAFDALSARLKQGAQPFKRQVGYRGGYGEFTVYWHQGHGFWCLFDPDYAGSRFWCAFGSVHPAGENLLSITCEINSPYEGFNRRDAGVFLRDEEDRLYLGHSGKIGGGRKGIGKTAFLAAYRGGNLHTVKWPDGAETDVIVIGRVDGERLPAHVAAFVTEVDRFKEGVVSGARPERAPAGRLAFTPEFSGPRRAYSPSGTVEARLDHSLVVNALEAELRAKGCQTANTQKRDLFVVASDAITHLFEAKADLSTTSIYQAVGQLMLLGVALKPPPKRILVVPGSPDATTRSALDRLGIEVLEFSWAGDTPVFSGLEQTLK